MPITTGRVIAFYWDTTDLVDETTGTLLCASTASLTYNDETIDVTTTCDDGWRALLNDPAVRSLDINVSGFTKDESTDQSNSYRVDWHAGTTTKNMIVAYPDGSRIAGVFRMLNLTEEAPANGAYTHTVDFQSSGALTFTAAP